jgi:hypothetical protein
VGGGADGQEFGQAFYDAEQDGLKIGIQEASGIQD